jgi:hypothetical protein
LIFIPELVLIALQNLHRLLLRGYGALVVESHHGENTVRAVFFACLATSAALLASCAPSPEEQAAAAAAQHSADQNKCYGYGFQPGTDAFARCMMSTATQRDAQQAADRRSAAAQQAATDRQNASIKAAKDAADRDAWDRRTGQGAYANSPSITPAYSPPQQPTSSLSTDPVDKVRNSIQSDMDKMENAGTVSP